MNPFQVHGKTKLQPEQLRFVESVRVRRERHLSWKQALLGLFWILVIAKSFLAHWAIAYWEMPIRSIWVWGPTVVAAILCTVVFLAGSEDTD